MFGVLFGHRFAGVHDCEHGVLAVRGEIQPYLVLSAAVLGGVVEQSRDQPVERVAVAHDADIRRDTALEGKPLFKTHRVERQAGALRDLAEVHLDHGQGIVLHFGQLQHADDEAVHALYLRVDGVHPAGVFRHRGIGLGLHDREVGGNDREGSFEFVRGVRDEVALLSERLADGRERTRGEQIRRQSRDRHRREVDERAQHPDRRQRAAVGRGVHDGVDGVARADAVAGHRARGDDETHLAAGELALFGRHGSFRDLARQRLAVGSELLDIDGGDIGVARLGGVDEGETPPAHDVVGRTPEVVDDGVESAVRRRGHGHEDDADEQPEKHKKYRRREQRRGDGELLA